MDNYAILDPTGLVINVVVVDPTIAPPDPAWIDLTTNPLGVWIGWTTPDKGTTWVAPPEPVPPVDPNAPTPTTPTS